ncbi:MAG: nicotinate-nucleotide adenylyltransferase [Anaerolineae bacterium]
MNLSPQMPSQGRPTRIGLIGGTFDPIHIGHLVLAEEARAQAQLDRVLFVPAGQPPHKMGHFITPVEHRLRMVEIAIASNPAFGISRLDMDRPGPHYSVDMVRLFQEQSSPEVEVFFVVGADSLQEMPTWKNPAGLLSLCRVLALSRPGHEPDMERLIRELPEMEANVQVLKMPLVGISASGLRERVRKGQTIRYLVPDGVREYIYTHGLYIGEVVGEPVGSLEEIAC